MEDLVRPTPLKGGVTFSLPDQQTGEQAPRSGKKKMPVPVPPATLAGRALGLRATLTTFYSNNYGN